MQTRTQGWCANKTAWTSIIIHIKQGIMIIKRSKANIIIKNWRAHATRHRFHFTNFRPSMLKLLFTCGVWVNFSSLISASKDSQEAYGKETFDFIKEISSLALLRLLFKVIQKLHGIEALVGVYRQACSGIPLAVKFVGRDRRLWNSMAQGTERFR